MGAAIPSSARVSTSCWIHSCLGWCSQPWQPGATSQGHQAGPSSLPWGRKVTGALYPCPAGRSTLGQPPLVLCKAHSCVSTLGAPGRAGTGLVRHRVGHSLLPAAPAALAPRLELCTGPPRCRGAGLYTAGTPGHRHFSRQMHKFTVLQKHFQSLTLGRSLGTVLPTHMEDVGIWWLGNIYRRKLLPKILFSRLRITSYFFAMWLHMHGETHLVNI